jgi:hypothetical protein
MLVWSLSSRERPSYSFERQKLFQSDDALPLAALSRQEIAGPQEKRGGVFRAIINVMR